MHLIQILLPLYDNAGKRIHLSLHNAVKRTLTKKFSGLTTYGRAPAEGLWQRGARTQREKIIVYEVMVAAPDNAWWRKYRADLEKTFNQDTVVIRAHPIVVF